MFLLLETDVGDFLMKNALAHPYTCIHIYFLAISPSHCLSPLLTPPATLSLSPIFPHSLSPCLSLSFSPPLSPPSPLPPPASLPRASLPRVKT